MKKYSVFAVISLVGGGLLGTLLFYLHLPLRSPVSSLEVKEYIRILDKYSLSRLQTRAYIASPITLERELSRKPEYIAYLFSFMSDGKRVTGQANIPNVPGKRPVIVMLRGFVDKEIYQTGIGTRPAADVFAKQGYLTLAPDFLGYGESEQESFDTLEARFEKPVTVLNLLASIGSLPKANTQRIGLWGHSNGGQIAITVLEATTSAYPTTLWAPVTMKFPDSILQFVDELPDKGEYLRKILSEFHERYEDREYSIDGAVENIASPIQLHQGTKDESVPTKWSQDFSQRLKELKKTVQYFEYPGENHNFGHGAWQTVVNRDLEFFKKNL